MSTQTTFGPYPGTVESIHDGDTLRVAVDLGWDITVHADVRLFGCNAPELATQAGKAARAELVSLLPIGSSVTLLSHGYDKYGGRIDGSITLGDGRDLTATMISLGAAAPWDGQGPKPVPAADAPASSSTGPES